LLRMITEPFSLDEALLFALEAAHEAGERLRLWFGTQSFVEKDDRSPVTAADLAAERFLVEAIHQRFPAHGLLSEEEHSRYEGHEWTWVIDPLDGTTNYANGLPYWAVSMALAHEGRPVVGVVHLPIPGETYHAIQDRGAFLSGHRIHVSPATRFDINDFLAVYSHTHNHYTLEALPSKPRIYGSAAHDFCLVARGTALMGMETRAKVWDVAAGWLLVEEAGGVVRLYDGGSAFPLAPGDYQARPLATLCAANEALWQETRARVLPRAASTQQAFTPPS